MLREQGIASARAGRRRERRAGQLAARVPGRNGARVPRARTPGRNELPLDARRARSYCPFTGSPMRRTPKPLAGTERTYVRTGAYTELQNGAFRGDELR